MIDNPLNRLSVKRGEQLPHTKLTEADVINIRALVDIREDLKQQASELTARKIAEKFGVHYRTIDRITAGEIWTHI